jgi:hypothetical protein
MLAVLVVLAAIVSCFSLQGKLFILLSFTSYNNTLRSKVKSSLAQVSFNLKSAKQQFLFIEQDES